MVNSRKTSQFGELGPSVVWDTETLLSNVTI